MTSISAKRASRFKTRTIKSQAGVRKMYPRYAHRAMKAAVVARVRADNEVKASFAVDNLRFNPDTAYIHELHNQGRITSEQAVSMFKKHYQGLNEATI